LQQSLRDLDAAYRNFFDGLKGKRPRTGPPRFKSRKDTRHSVRFTANARWSITPGQKLRLRDGRSPPGVALLRGLS
jgi:putative transposase